MEREIASKIRRQIDRYWDRKRDIEMERWIYTIQIEKYLDEKIDIKTERKIYRLKDRY